MRPVLSPAESLGLAGAALDSRIRRAAHHVSDAIYARLAKRLRDDALANEMIYERDGERDAVLVMLRPLVAMREQMAYVHNVCLQIQEALKRVPALYLEDERIRKILTVTPDEDRWVRDIWTPAHLAINPIYGRLDAVCDFAGAQWRDSLHFMEANLSGVGGIYFAPLSEQLVMRDVVPTLAAHDPQLALELPPDQRDLFLQVLIDHARAVGRDASRIAFIEPKYVHDGPDEQGVLRRYLSQRHGVSISHADPRELRLKDGEVYYEDTQIDIAYRDYETRELLDLERELGKKLDAIRHLFKQNRVVSSLVGDFDHKSCFEILTDPEIANRLYSAEDCRLFRRHVLWTRIVGNRKTTLPHDAEGDLLEYARGNREQLVLKPNRGYGGKGVMLGAAVEQGEWESQLNEAAGQMNDPEHSWVVQKATRIPVYEFPVVGADGRVFAEPYYTVMGFAATGDGLGNLCRVSQKQVVNVAQRGGVAAVLVTDSVPDLRMPKRSMRRADGAQQTLRAQVSELRHLDNVIALLGWDEETMLPSAGRPERGEQLASLEGIRHALLVSERLGDLVEEVAHETENDEGWQREVALLRRIRQNALAVPEDLVRYLANAKSQSLGAWEEARLRDDFDIFSRPFDRLLSLVRERASALAGNGDPYDALLGEFEHGMTRSRLDPVLDEVKSRLVPLVKEASRKPAGAVAQLEGKRFSEQGQWDLCRRVLSSIGFEFDRGRLDKSTHPFTLYAGGHDVRLTTRFTEDDLTDAVLATLHEGGHGLYDQGFDASDHGALLAEAPSMGLHESQSRLWENHVGRSLGFWRHAFRWIEALFPGLAAGVSPEAFHRAVNLVRPGVNRVSADELSYHLHIALRYELESALLSGQLPVRDLPGVWNRRSEEMIGVRPASDRDGVLQDVHWSLGMIGYFPTYTLGSLYAAQLAETYAKKHPLADEIAHGEFDGLRNWLRASVHRVGHRYEAEEIVLRATGKGLDAAAFFRHVETSQKSLGT